MKISKTTVEAAGNSPILYFTCPICHNKTVVDSDNEVHKLSDIGYKDLFICEECGAELEGELTHDMRVKLIPKDDVESCDEIMSGQDIFPEFSTIKQEIYDKCVEVLKTAEFGFDDDLIDDYLFLEMRPDDDRLRIEVRCELSFDGMMKLIHQLDPIVQKYDEYAYFDMEDAGIATAYLDKFIKSSENVEGVIRTDLGQDLEPYYDEGPTETYFDDEISIYIKDTITVDETGDYSFPDDERPWAESDGGSWESNEMSSVFLDDDAGVQEKVEILLLPYIPNEEGIYQISCYVTLIYHVYDISDYGDWVDADDASIEYDKSASLVEGFKVKKV